MRVAKSTVRYYVAGLRRELGEKDIGLWSQAIAFKVLVTTIPLTALALGIAGWVLQGSEASAAVAQFVTELLPADQGRAVLSFLDVLQATSPAIASIGGISLLISVVFLFTTLRMTVSNTFEQKGRERRTTVQGYLFDLRMTGQVGLLFLAIVVLSIGIQYVPVGSHLLQFASAGMSLLIAAMMFGQLYYFVPQPRPPVRSAVVGAAVAGVLWEVAKQTLTLLATSTHPLDADSPTAGIEALAEGFVLIIAFVTWVYYSGLVLLIGAVVASLHAMREDGALNS